MHKENKRLTFNFLHEDEEKEDITYSCVLTSFFLLLVYRSHTHTYKIVQLLTYEANLLRIVAT